MIYDCLICGGGTAGLTAAVYLARAGLSALVFEKSFAGGQIALTPEIENFPGLKKGTGGAEFSENLLNQAVSFGAEIKYEEVLSISSDADFKSVTTDSGSYRGKNLIIATGAYHKKLGLENEDRLVGNGISYCAVCDGGFFRNKTVAVVGGGNTAVSDALYLSEICERVYLFHRRDKLKAENYLTEKIKARNNIEVIYNASITELCGFPLSGINVTVNNERKAYSVSALFVAIGLVPEASIASGIAEISDGYIMTKQTETGVDGVYAVGDVQNRFAKQLVFAAADGAMAALKIIEKQ